MPIIIVLDVSSSMGISMQVPSFQLATHSLEVFLDFLTQNQKFEDVAVVGFSSTAKIICPFTRDYSSIKNVVSDLEVGGSTSTLSIFEALNQVISEKWGPYQAYEILLFTDGTSFISRRLDRLLHRVRTRYVKVKAEPPPPKKFKPIEYMCNQVSVIQSTSTYNRMIMNEARRIHTAVIQSSAKPTTMEIVEDSDKEEDLPPPITMADEESLVFSATQEQSDDEQSEDDNKPQRKRVRSEKVRPSKLEDEYMNKRKVNEDKKNFVGKFSRSVPVSRFAKFELTNFSSEEMLVTTNLEDESTTEERGIVRVPLNVHFPCKVCYFIFAPDQNDCYVDPAVTFSENFPIHDKPVMSGHNLESATYSIRTYFEQHHLPNSITLRCGDKVAKVCISPQLMPHSTMINFKKRKFRIGKNIDIYGFIPMSNIGIPPSVSRHVIYPYSGPEIQERSEEAHPDAASLITILYTALHEDEVVALCKVGDDWYGLILVSEDEDIDIPNLVLLTFYPNSSTHSWLGDIKMLGIHNDWISEYVEHFPVLPSEKRSYNQSVVLWIKEAGLNADIQKVLRTAKKLPDRTYNFYKDLNRLRRAAIAFGFPELLEAFANIFEIECTNLPGTAHPDCALQLTNVVTLLRDDDASNPKYILTPLETKYYSNSDGSQRKENGHDDDNDFKDEVDHKSFLLLQEYDNSLVCIHKSWLRPERRFFYPPHVKKIKDGEALARMCVPPDENNWTMHSYLKLLAESDDIDEIINEIDNKKHNTCNTSCDEKSKKGHKCHKTSTIHRNLDSQRRRHKRLPDVPPSLRSAPAEVDRTFSKSESKTTPSKGNSQKRTLNASKTDSPSIFDNLTFDHMTYESLSVSETLSLTDFSYQTPPSGGKCLRTPISSPKASPSGQDRLSLTSPVSSKSANKTLSSHSPDTQATPSRRKRFKRTPIASRTASPSAQDRLALTLPVSSKSANKTLISHSPDTKTTPSREKCLIRTPTAKRTAGLSIRDRLTMKSPAMKNKLIEDRLLAVEN